jgi:hypothetical protein
MKVRLWKYRRARDIARSAGYVLSFVATAALLSWLELRRRGKRPRVPTTADERTMRRIAEAQAGGMSTEEGRARYESGEHPGGLHGKAERPPPDLESFEDEEPHDRLEIHRGSRRIAMPAMRR